MTGSHNYWTEYKCFFYKIAGIDWEFGDGQEQMFLKFGKIMSRMTALFNSAATLLCQVMPHDRTRLLLTVISLETPNM